MLETITYIKVDPVI